MSKNLLEILSENDIQVRKKGDKWVAHCPLHEGDRTPSFTVYPDLSFFCFGCRKGGDAVNFLTLYKGMPWELALEYAGIESRRQKPIKRVIKVQNVMQIYPYLYDVADLYHKFLRQTPGAVQYLKGRGLTDETIDKYKIGYTDGALVNPATAFDYGLARDSNVISEDKDHNYWETMSHRITIPNLHSGNLCDFIMGRTVTKSSVKYLGLRIPKPIYGLIEAAHSPVMFLVEGHFDWLILKQWGVPAITGGGTNIPPYNLIPLKNKLVVIIPDNDEEGMKAAVSLQSRLPTSILLDYTVLGVKDVGELGAQPDGREKFFEVVNNQKWVHNLSSTTFNQFSTRLTALIPSL